MRPLIPLIALTAALLATGCNRQSETPVPKRTAYPRIESYGDSTRMLRLGGMEFAVNAQAEVSSPRDGWLDITYPRYGASFHITARHFDSAEALAEAIENRTVRISLNLGDRQAVSTEFITPTAFTAIMLSSLDGGSSPVHFMAYNTDGYMLSGSAVLTGVAEPVDSIAPVVEGLTADAERILRSIRTP